MDETGKARSMVATRESSDPNRDLWWAHTLYYKDNYPRLQRIKTCWDPRNVFHHALSIRA